MAHGGLVAEDSVEVVVRLAAALAEAVLEEVAQAGVGENDTIKP